jgi:hypothetical protein
VNLLLERAHRLLHDHVVLDALGRAPDDEADRAGGASVDEDLARPDDDRVSDLGIGDRDPRDVELGRDDR